jgi:cell wall-associated NlpC family hydrolase
MKNDCILSRLLAACLGLFAADAHADDSLRDGDIIFHTSRSAQSSAIQRATRSPYSHVGIILLRDGKPFVLEAVATVRYTPLESWIARGNAGHYVVRRLKRGLSSGEATKLRVAAKRFAGKPYDLYFEWSDARIYCSELVWKIYREGLGVELGRLQKLREFDLKDSAVKAKMRERYGTKVPLDEPVISPAALFDSDLLITASKN